MRLGPKNFSELLLRADPAGRCAVVGSLDFHPVTKTFLNGRTVTLSRREGDLVRLLSQGLKNKEIASVLCISEDTVKVYLSKLFAKTGVKDRFELTLFGLKHLQPRLNHGGGLIETPTIPVPATDTISSALQRIS